MHLSAVYYRSQPFSLCFTSHQQRVHLEMAPPFTVSCEGREAQFLHCSNWESNPGPSRGSPLHYPCAMPALDQPFRPGYKCDDVDRSVCTTFQAACKPIGLAGA